MANTQDRIGVSRWTIAGIDADGLDVGRDNDRFPPPNEITIW